MDCDDLVFNESLKKKKKQRTVGQEEFDFGKRKKKKNKKTKQLIEEKGECDSPYTYKELLDRLYGLLKEHGHDISERNTKITIPAPKLGYEGSRKTVCVNFGSICEVLSRDRRHVMDFVIAEIASDCSIDGKGRLVMKGKINQKDFEVLLRHYIRQYVQCWQCGSHATYIAKIEKLLWVSCDTCLSKRSVKEIRQGFRAKTSKKRNKQ